jgi:hypothetical protein
MRAYRRIDADCHSLEPPRIWETCMMRAYGLPQTLAVPA